LGEDLKGLQKDITCHYFVNIKGIRVNGPTSSKDDASCLASSWWKSKVTKIDR